MALPQGTQPVQRATFSLTDILADTPPIRILNVGAADISGQAEAYEALVDAGYATVIGF